MNIWNFFNPRETNEQHRPANQETRDSAPAQHPGGDPWGAAARALGIALAKQAIYANPYTNFPRLTLGLANQAACQNTMSGPLPTGTPSGLGYVPAPGGMNPYQQGLQALMFARLNPPPGLTAPPLPREKPAVGELIGHRAWLIKDGKLHSISMMTGWIPGKTMTDGCPENGDMKIRDDNHAGIWAFKDPYTLGRELYGVIDPNASSAYHFGVLGTVWLWGTVIEHEHGYRAQYAAIRSLEKAAPGIDLEALRATYLKA